MKQTPASIVKRAIERMIDRRSAAPEGGKRGR